MRNRLLEDFSEEQILSAAKVYLKKKLNWDEEPIEVYIDPDSILLIYENEGDEVASSFHDDGIYLVYVKGKMKKFRWIEFEHYDDLKR